MSTLLAALAYAGAEEPPLSWCAKLVIIALVLCLLVMVLAAVWPHDRYPEGDDR